MPVNKENISLMELDDLRDLWQLLWGKTPHPFIRRQMLEKSVSFKQAESSGTGLDPIQKARLDKLVRQYKRDPKSFDKKQNLISSGSILVRIWRGRKYVVTVYDDRFGYEGITYSSLSQIATLITGTRWNGRAFFGLKKGEKGDRQ